MAPVQAENERSIRKQGFKANKMTVLVREIKPGDWSAERRPDLLKAVQPRNELIVSLIDFGAKFPRIGGIDIQPFLKWAGFGGRQGKSLRGR
jgi:hypothetical protein